MTTNKIVENDEREENKRGIIIFITILVLLLALFIGIRALSGKEDKTEKEDKKPIEQVEEKETEDEQIEETTYVYTPKKTTKVKKTANEENKETLTLVLKGNNVIYVDYGDSYIDEGAYALDTKEGDLSIAVVKTIYLNGNVVDTIDTTNSGATYTIRYMITNSRGETKEITRTVIIKEADVTMTLLGNKEDTMEYSISNTEVYNDLGVTATTTDQTNVPVTKIVTFNDIDYTGEIKNDVLGTYIITYIAEYDGKEYKTERTIVVKDTTAPTIETAQDTYEYDLQIGSEISIDDLQALFTISDEDVNIMTTLTDENELEVNAIDRSVAGEYTVILTAKDSSLNIAKKEITIKIIDPTSIVETVELSEAVENTDTYDFTVTTNKTGTIEYALVEDINVINDSDWNLVTGNAFSVNKTDVTDTKKYVVVRVKGTDANDIISTSKEIPVIVLP